MISLHKLAKKEIINTEHSIHGGEVWVVASRYGIDVKEILDFSANVNPMGPPAKSLEVIKESISNINFYPDSNCNQLREAISEYFKTITPRNVIVGNGSTELIYMFTSLFIKKDDEAIIPIPTFSEYEVAVKRSGGKPVYISLRKDFQLPLRTVINNFTPKTKVVFLCNPNNPTGTILSIDKLLKIVDNALKHDILVFIDETFMDFIPNEEHFSLISKVEEYWNIFILRSFTKFFGLAGLRIGYGIACKEMIELMNKTKIPWNVNYLAQVAAMAALKDKEYIEKTRRIVIRERNFLYKELNNIRGLRVYPSSVNFLLINLSKSGLTSRKLKTLLLKHNILIRDCSTFRGLNEFFIRIAVRNRQENLMLIKALREILE